MFDRLFARFLAFVYGCLGLALMGCSSLTPAQSARADAFACRVAALAPLVEPMHDAAELLRKLEDGSADLRHVLMALDATQADFNALVERLQACDPPPPVGSPVPVPSGATQTRLVAPPPAYGNRVL